MPSKRSYQIQLLDHVPPALLEDMLMVIRETIPYANLTTTILSRSKFILTELVTNAIKHANSMVTDVTIDVGEHFINITKTDSGDRFIMQQIKSDKIAEGDVITSDIMHTLYTISKNERVNFYCLEHPEPSFDDEHNYPEHFGLLIITKASDEFYYAYDQNNRINTFSATINF